jgi:hypothetical protein
VADMPRCVALAQRLFSSDAIVRKVKAFSASNANNYSKKCF